MATEIVLSIYKGAEYLSDFLDSLVEQTATNWFLTVRDDGSPDDSVGIVQRHSRAHGYEVRWHPSSGARLGYPETYFTLLHDATGEVVFFADQDDIWSPEKLALMTPAVQAFGEQAGLVHTDLVVVDSQNRQVAPSFLDLDRGRPPRSSSVLGLLLMNYVTGAATACNLALCKILRKPRISVPHDWWSALTARLFGEVHFLDVAPVRYRQHDVNIFGAFPETRSVGINRGWLGLGFQEKTVRNRQFAFLADEALAIYGDVLRPGVKEELEWFARLDTGGPLDLMRLVRTGALPKNGRMARHFLELLTRVQLKEKAMRVLHPIASRRLRSRSGQ